MTVVVGDAPHLERDDAQGKFEQLMVVIAKNRGVEYSQYRPVGKTANSKQNQIRAQLLLQVLARLSTDIVAFVEYFAWSPDPQGLFGSDAIMRDPDCQQLMNHVGGPLIPPGKVPIVLFEKQRRVLREFQDALERPGKTDILVLKSRQVALTTIVMGWGFLWAWLFWPQFQGGLGSYDKDYIDMGGKGHRMAGSLFGRLRLFMDTMMLCCPTLKFNQHMPTNALKKCVQETGLTGEQDVSFRLVRPKWTVAGMEIFKSGEGNWIVGAIPGDTAFRSLTLVAAGFDELGHYGKISKNAARDAWAATVANVKVRVGGGTIFRGGGSGTMFHELVEGQTTGSRRKVHKIHWSDLPAYMHGARWVCRACSFHNGHPVAPGPGTEGVARRCGKCRHEQLVTIRDLWSPWYAEQRDAYAGDNVGVACELDMDWMAAQGDMLCSNLSPNIIDVFKDEPPNLSYTGFDPGWTMSNAGSWMLVRLDPVTMTPWLVGYWMAAPGMAEYWVPFFKGWNREQVKRMSLRFGKFSSKTFQEAFNYPEEALAMLDKCACVKPGGAMGWPLGHIEGDKFGSVHTGADSAYDVIERHGVYVNHPKTADRQSLVQEGISWTVKLRIDAEIAHVRPPTPLGGQFPSAYQCFTTAKPREQAGQSEYRLDVDKSDPPHVSNGFDAFLYLVRGINSGVAAQMDPYGADHLGYDGAVDLGVDLRDRSFD